MYIEKEINVKALYENYGTEFYRLTNKLEKHNNLQYKTGLNIDILPFNPTGTCSSGGMYFFSRKQLINFYCYTTDIHYMRKVTFPDNARIYVEHNKFKCDRFILGEKQDFIIQDDLWLDIVRNFNFKVNTNNFYFNLINNKCIEMIKENWRIIKIIKFQTDDICITAIKQQPLAIKYVKDQTPELCFAAVKRWPLVIIFVHDQTEELCLCAVKRDKNLLSSIVKLIEKKL